MTTIFIKNTRSIKFQKTKFEDLNDFLNTVRQDYSDYNFPDFKDTIITKEVIEKAEETKNKIANSPELFFEI